jgi:hypothetical protein
MPHVCDVDYKITEAFNSGPREKNELVRIIILSTAKEVLYNPFHAVRKIADYLKDYTKI